MDSMDEKILQTLMENSTLSKRKIAKKIGAPLTTVFHRIKRMEKEGIIRRYTVITDPEKLGYRICAYILVSVKQNPSEGKRVSQQEIASYITRMFANVESVAIITGEFDLIIKARFKSIKQLNEFLTSRLRNIEGIDRTITSIVLEEMSRF